MYRPIIISAILVTVASAAIGSTLSAGRDHVSRHMETARLADAYNSGGSGYAILSGVTVKHKTSHGCATQASNDGDREPIARSASLVFKKQDRLSTTGCELAMAG